MSEVNKFGFKLGDRFEVISSVWFDDGGIVELYYDDGSDQPEFQLVSDANKLFFENYSNLKKID